MGLLRPGRDVIPGTGVHPGMDWPVASPASAPKRRLGVLAQQHDHTERLRRLALRRPRTDNVEFPGRNGAYLKTRGGGNGFYPIRYTIDPIPADAGGAGVYSHIAFMPFIADSVIDERFYLGLWIDYEWPTRVRIDFQGQTIWNGPDQAVFTPDGDAYDPATSAGFLGHDDALDELAYFGPVGNVRYLAASSWPQYHGGNSFYRTGFFYAPEMDSFFGAPRTQTFELTVSLLNEAGTAMDETWAHAYHDAKGVWPPPLTIQSAAIRMDQDLSDAIRQLGTFVDFTLFDTVKFADPGFTAERKPGTELPDLTAANLPNAIGVSEPGWYYLAAGPLNVDPSLISTGVLVTADWGTGNATLAGSGQAAGLIEIPEVPAQVIASFGTPGPFEVVDGGYLGIWRYFDD